MTDIIKAVRDFTQAVGCTTDQYNVRQTALYIGLQLEEMKEKLESLGFNNVRHSGGFYTDLMCALHKASLEFKEGAMDIAVEEADRAAMLDADVDLAWVTIGSMFSQGADVEGACGEVARANMSKLVECDVCEGSFSLAISQGESHTSKFDPCQKCNGLGLVAIKDENGKVKKPASFVPPNIEPFVRKG
ncbi:MAG TPA: hypothetical protein VK149_12070 [Sideroxyarcus sp.]|nr:hypothetical protein [Sideroxyarcus sp.]